MKTRFALAALALGTTALVPSALAQESLDGKATITATLDAKTKKVTIVVKGQENKDTIYVNKEYPIKCDLKIATGGTLEKAKLTKDDAKYEDSGKEGKAKSATFVVGADKAVEGECKVVVCQEKACSSPFKVTFKSN